MPGGKNESGELTDIQFELIDWVVGAVVKLGTIPSMQAIADGMAISRQAVATRMDRMANAGIMPKRPPYAIRWFALTPLGEELYARALRDVSRKRPLWMAKDR